MKRFALLVFAAAAAAIAVARPHDADAQAVRGRLIDSVSRMPLPATLVTLIDEHGTERAQTVSDASGQYLLTAPVAGSYHVRAKRIGFRPLVSPPLQVSGAEPRTYNAAIDPIPIALDEVVVAGDRQCDVEAGASTAALWEEVRAALAAVAWTSRSPVYRYDIVYFERDLSPGGRQLGHDSTWHYVGFQQVPVRSAPPESLATTGYVITGESWKYFGPDADALLSDAFLRTHCFETKIGKGETEGLVGLAFAPARGRKLPDIAGTLWLDRTSAELRHLEFKYTRLPEHVDAPQAGGRLEFMRVPTGAWIVRDWSLRMPLAKEGRTPTGQVGAPVVYGYRESGARAFEIKGRDGAIVFRAEPLPDSAVVVAAAAPPAPPAAPPTPATPPVDTAQPAPVVPVPAATAAAPTAAPAQPADTTPAKPKRTRSRRSNDVLDQDEFSGSSATDAYQLVQQYRPNWLASRGSTSFGNAGSDALQVYVNNINFGDVTHLHDVPASDVVTMRHLSGPDATTRYGLNHAGGVIEVQTH
ncbi:MAG TPA: carboxypeptidase-like regulatory domain-containing protein [Gemmatimonadales bacterium]|jgi:hypothetical protein|nr:carboxypeptidase-like regulatory domain-containing protein [Gemmatimonadales bacterium]